MKLYIYLNKFLSNYIIDINTNSNQLGPEGSVVSILIQIISHFERECMIPSTREKGGNSELYEQLASNKVNAHREDKAQNPGPSLRLPNCNKHKGKVKTN